MGSSTWLSLRAILWWSLGCHNRIWGGKGRKGRKGGKVRLLIALFVVVAMSAAQAQVSKFVSVTTEMLVNPSPDDWLMYSRTYDAQRFSPLKQINRQNVGQLKTAGRTRWARWGTSRAFRSCIAASCTSCCRARACARSTPPTAP